jgi:hypothetical protein
MVPVAVTFVTPVPPINGLLFVAVTEYTTPRSVIAAPLSLVTFPLRVAPVAVIEVAVGAVTVGAANDAARVSVTV